MVFRLAREADVKLSPEIATCLYTALMTDTGSFMFQGTNEHTFCAGARIGAGGSRSRALRARHLLCAFQAKLRLLGEALRNLQQEGHLAWVWVTQEQMERCGAQGRRLRRTGELRSLDR